MPRAIVVALLVAGCSFKPQPTASSDAPAPAVIDAPRDSRTPDGTTATCGNGIREPGEACDGSGAIACATSCGDIGATSCSAQCTLNACKVTIDPASSWEVSTNGVAWSPVVLPHTNYPCDNCTRFYRTTICDAPTAVAFEWSSDNRARMEVNATSAFSTFWIAGYCTDAPCCAKCCDSNANCLANLSAPQTLGAPALSLFAPGPNVMRWEVGEEVGGSGFYTVMTVTY